MRNGLELGYSEADFERMRELGCAQLEAPEDIEKVVDKFGYLADWRASYVIQSVRSSLHNSKVTCIDAAILSYGLLELFFPDVKRRILAIHRRDQNGEECGHCVTLYWGDNGKVGSFAKSNYEGLGCRLPTLRDETAIATSYAQEYIKMGFEPLYFGVTTLEEAAPDVDWRFHQGELNVLSDLIQAKYEYAFTVPR